jgi:hypothetical protein
MSESVDDNVTHAEAHQEPADNGQTPPTNRIDVPRILDAWRTSRVATGSV